MSDLQTFEDQAGELAAAPRRSRFRGVLTELAVVGLWFVVAGLVAGLVWWRITPLAEFTRTSNGLRMGEEQLGVQVSSDGWFAVIAMVGGALSGLLLAAWRRRDSVVTVLLLPIGAGIATGLMVLLGDLLGPADPRSVSTASLAVGDKVPLQLHVHAHGVLLIWPLAALLGAFVVLIFLLPSSPRSVPPPRPGADWPWPAGQPAGPAQETPLAGSAESGGSAEASGPEDSPRSGS